MSGSIVFDTGPLRHFALGNWLGVLKFLAGDRHVVIPSAVSDELLRQIDDEPRLRTVLEADWIARDDGENLTFLEHFARYQQQLVRSGSRENLGECAVLALGRTFGWEIVLDDREARQIAEDDDLRVTATLPLLCRGIRENQLTLPQVEHIADELIAGQYHLPFQTGGFRRWALEEGLIDYDGPR